LRVLGERERQREKRERERERESQACKSLEKARKTTYRVECVVVDNDIVDQAISEEDTHQEGFAGLDEVRARL
jgi:hypothetical protein